MTKDINGEFVSLSPHSHNYKFRSDIDIIHEADVVLALKNNKIRVIKNRNPEDNDIYPINEPTVIMANSQGNHNHNFAQTYQENPFITKAVNLNNAIEIGIDLIAKVFFEKADINSFTELFKERLREHINYEIQRFK